MKQYFFYIHQRLFELNKELNDVRAIFQQHYVISQAEYLKENTITSDEKSSNKGSRALIQYQKANALHYGIDQL